MDLALTDDKAILMLELPGLDKESISLDVLNGRLVVSGEKTILKDVEEKGFVHRERQMSRFSHIVLLPTGIKTANVQAKMDSENGLLTVTFLKRSQEQQAQRITIA
ncbi:HSP20-like chaperone [Fomitiporia mediterranea MF3/22]|uniref:HSP20-like chaperone n=1 Tax=Fomitiporia mediterranea (strain MF3/22) TaxID=694068 RepID=UPI0004407CBB|nr:HSP20-like chaperone [Fomitiporia mediterranea MF3/22]EJC98616.1 HSP20-like chaperone [Fomitiporia mediterranea MF3/22]